MNSGSIVRLVLIICCISLIGNVGLLYQYWSHPHASEASFPLLSPSVRSEEPSRDLIVNVNDLRQSLFEKTASYSAHIGLYFDYIPTSATIGINQRQPFSLASLLKIPVAMAIYEKIAEGRLSPQQSITLTTEMLNTHYGTLWKQGAGTTITVEQALELLLVESDNTASEALMSVISPEEIGRVFSAFDMPTIRNEQETLVITAKGYTSIIRSLYFSTHLRPEFSQKILALLSKSITLDGKPFPIPSPIDVAHKIGVHDLTSTYSDCGIVYYPRHPYIYCVMVKDKPMTEAAAIIRDLSQTMYHFIDSTVKGF